MEDVSQSAVGDNIPEIRNYSMVGGFMATFLWCIIIIGAFIGTEAEYQAYLEYKLVFNMMVSVQLFISASALAFVKKRDMTAITFFMMSAIIAFLGLNTGGNGTEIPFYIILLIMGVMFLFTKDEQRFTGSVLCFIMGSNVISYFFQDEKSLSIGTVIIATVLAAVCIYFTVAIMYPKKDLPLKVRLTADEVHPEKDGIPVDFKVAGSTIGYMLFAAPILAYTLYYANFDFVTLQSCEEMTKLISLMIIAVSMIMLLAGKMKYTPFMFMMTGMGMFIGICINEMGQVVFIFLLLTGIMSLIRREANYFSGLMLIVYSLTSLTSAAYGGFYSVTLSLILNAVSFLLCVYICFAVYSDGKYKIF